MIARIEAYVQLGQQGPDALAGVVRQLSALRLEIAHLVIDQALRTEDFFMRLADVPASFQVMALAHPRPHALLARIVIFLVLTVVVALVAQLSLFVGTEAGFVED